MIVGQRGAMSRYEAMSFHLETERLLLRPWAEAGADRLRALLSNATTDAHGRVHRALIVKQLTATGQRGSPCRRPAPGRLSSCFTAPRSPQRVLQDLTSRPACRGAPGTRDEQPRPHRPPAYPGAHVRVAGTGPWTVTVGRMNGTGAWRSRHAGTAADRGRPRASRPFSGCRRACARSRSKRAATAPDPSWLKSQQPA